jgi:hypothetical protein
MRSLDKVTNFGGIDADADNLLEEAFQDHDAYQAARDHKRFLVLGRKGSGKTAIFKKLITTRDPVIFPIGHTFADYPWDHHKLQAGIGVPEEQRYYHSWQYLVLITAAKVLLNNDGSQPWSEAAFDALGTLEKFVVDSYGSRDPDVTQLFTPSKRLRIKPHLKVANAFDVGVDLERLPMGDLPKVVQEVNKNIADAVITCLNPQHDYYVCFDELDRSFDPKSEQYSQMLIGLVLAARALNQRARDSGKAFSVVVFLRDDIYEMLRFEDKNKVTENYAVRIAWDQPKSQWTLKSLMERRFSATLSPEGVGAWGDVFDEKQQMTGRQSKYQHILDRTFRRPRDVIKFCNEVLEVYKHRNDRAASQFSNEDVIAARRNYSDYFLRELDDEIHKHLPAYEDYLEIIKGVGALQFKLTEFQQACDRRRELNADDRPGVEILRDLFRFSIVAYQRTGGAGGGSEYVWSYLDPRARFDDSASSFRVHPGLIEALGLKRFRLSEKPEVDQSDLEDGLVDLR